MDLQKAFPIGSDLEVMVLEADAAKHRIRLSARAIAAAAEAAEVREYAARSAAQTPSFASLAEKLRGAMTAKK